MQERLEDALLAAELDGLAISSGRARTPPRDDVPLPFRAEPHFLSWLPLPKVEGAIVALRPGRRPVLVFPRSADFWHAPPAEPEGYWVEHFDIRVVDSAEAAWRLAEKVARGSAVIADDAPASAALGPVNPPLLLNALAYARAVKTGYEIACIARANAIAAIGHREVARAFGDGSSEFDLHQTYLGATRLPEHEFPYRNIVAVNEHAAVLHYQHLDTEPPAAARSLLIDAGAHECGYAADVTRTWANGVAEFDELIESMDGLQQSICRSVAANVEFVELNERTHRALAEVLSGHGIVRCGAAEAYESGVTRLFLPHGLGHLLGLQVHDVGGWQISPGGESLRPPSEHPFLRLTRRLEAGMTVTIEPGLYFIPALLNGASSAQRRLVDRETVERLSPLGGIRIEDDIVVEQDGHRNLTREAFAASAGPAVRRRRVRH